MLSHDAPDSTSIQPPVVKTSMMIRRPVAEVFQAFIDPAITTHFWFTKSSGKLEVGKTVQWEWEMYGAATDVVVKEIEPDKRILVSWSSEPDNIVEWIFEPQSDSETYVTITNSGFQGSPDERVAEALDSMGGFTFVLSGLKAYLEHDIHLNLVADKAPDAHVKTQ